MRRTGFTGDIWPDERQDLLLRAALAPGEAGARAWSQVRPQIDVDQLPGELHRLLPLLSRALTAHGIRDPELARLKGVHQFSWYRNSVRATAASGLLAQLEAAGVPSMLLRGAVAANHLRDGGLRVMNDVDVLVRSDDLEVARHTAEAAGWRAVPGTEHLERRRKAVWLVDDTGQRLSLHWAPSPNLPFTDQATAGLWERAVPAVLASEHTRMPSAADALVQAVADGARANSGASLRWVVDSVALVQSGTVHWPTAVAEARRCRLSALLDDALRYIADTTAAAVPRSALEALRSVPVDRREQFAHRLSTRTTPRVASGSEVVGRFVRLTADLPLRQAVAEGPGYVADELGIERRRDAPVAAARKLVRTLVSPPPPRASLSLPGSRSTPPTGARQ